MSQNLDRKELEGGIHRLNPPLAHAKGDLDQQNLSEARLLGEFTRARSRRANGARREVDQGSRRHACRDMGATCLTTYGTRAKKSPPGEGGAR